MNDKEMRELDAWIAEKVMGWTRMKFNTFWNHGCGAWQGQNPKEKQTESSHLNTAIPRYTTDPAAAMEVLKKCLEKSGYGLILDIHDDAGYSLEHRSPFNSHATGDETLELTICNFAKNLFSPNTLSDNYPDRF